MLNPKTNINIGLGTGQIESTFICLIEEHQLYNQIYEKWTTDLRQIPACLQSLIIRKYEANKKQYVKALLKRENSSFTYALLEFSCGSVNIFVSGSHCREFIDEIQEAWPIAKSVDNRVPIIFWNNSPNGPSSNSRSLEVPEWLEIGSNYSPTVFEELKITMEATNGDQLRNGRLILWTGEPGTGKTHALRGLARSWKDWAEFNYITDPEDFFGNASYMMRVILDNPSSNKWRVLVLEDAGEMIAADAKRQVGQGLSRLLNAVDGILGQGLKLLVLITTNDQLNSLHPAVTREGRCASSIEFLPLKAEQANEWLKVKGSEITVAEEMTVAELYAKLNGHKDIHKIQARKPIGFMADIKERNE